jgi:predicted Rossmann fold flavoprotein
VWDVLVEYIRQGNVQVISGTSVTGIVQERQKISYVTLANDQRIYAKAYILATGGLSRPETGSTGDGFSWLEKLGHSVAKPDPSLVPLTLKDDWVSNVAGVSLSDITLSLIEDGKKVSKQSGGMLFTHKGISGPAALNLSKEVGERLPYGPVVLSLDLLPKESLESLDTLLQKAIGTYPNRKIQNVLGNLIPGALVSVVLEQAEIEGDTPANAVTRTQRIALGKVMKSLPLNVKGRLGFEKAVIASGGVALSEVDTRTMRSRIIENLYIVGDLLNIDRPSGGYSLQLCWTTGMVAGQDAAFLTRL